MNDFLIDGDAGMGGIASRADLVTIIGTACSVIRHYIAASFVQVLGSNTKPHELLEFIKHCGGDGALLTHPGNLFVGFDQTHAAVSSGLSMKRPRVR